MIPITTTKEYVNQFGHRVRILATNLCTPKGSPSRYPVAVAYNDQVYCVTLDGNIDPNTSIPNEWALREVVPITTDYINVYANSPLGGSKRRIASTVYHSRAAADANASGDRTHVIEITDNGRVMGMMRYEAPAPTQDCLDAHSDAYAGC